MQPFQWGHHISEYLEDPQMGLNSLSHLFDVQSETAQFTCDRFAPEGTVKNLSQVCQTIRQSLLPTFEGGYEDYKPRRKTESDPRILTLESAHFLRGTKLSLRLRMKITPLKDGDVYTRVGHGVVTIMHRLSPIDHSLVKSGVVSDSSAQHQQTVITVNPPDYDEWLEKLRPLQEYQGGA